MEGRSPDKMRHNQRSSILTPPTPRVDSFSQRSSLGSSATAIRAGLSDDIISAPASRVTPPSTASSLKRARDTLSPEASDQNRDGVTSFATVDPPVVDLAVSKIPRRSLQSLGKSSQQPTPVSAGCDQLSATPSNNTIIHAIRQLGSVEYLQTVNNPRLLPAHLRPKTVRPEAATRASSKKNKRKGAPPKPKQASSMTNQTLHSANQLTNSELDVVQGLLSMDTVGHRVTKKRKIFADEMEGHATVTNSSRKSTVTKKRRCSETSRASLTNEPFSQEQVGAAGEESASSTPVSSSPLPAVKSWDQDWEPKKKSATPKVTTNKPSKSSPVKAKNHKVSKKSSIVSTNKPEKSRTKEQRWGDHLKSIVGGEKDVYHKLPHEAIPPLGSKIAHAPVRPYAFNKGKVQDYGDGTGLHAREMELAREVGLSYDAYRQQKRMAFIGYAAMQLEGKKEFKKSHTQSMCNIDGNKATHLWVHFHDVWGWMPEHPNPPVSLANLGGLQLPDLHVV